MVFEIFNWILSYFGMTSENTQVLPSNINELTENNADSLCYEKLIKVRDRFVQENERDVDALVNLADDFSHLEKFKDAIDIYALGFSLDTFREDHVMSFVKTLAKKTRKSLNKNKINCGPEVCYMCQGILLEPLTLPCGHTFCRNCLLNKNVPNVFCVKCNAKFTTEAVSKIKTNITISNVLEKLWSREIKTAKLRIAARELCNVEDYTNGILKYKEAEKLDPGDYLVQSGLCHALLATGKQTEALEHGQNAINLNPTFLKGYFYKGAALEKLGFYEEALTAYLHCLVLDDSDASVGTEIQKLVYRIIRAQHTGRSPSKEEATTCLKSQAKAKPPTCLTLSALCEEALKAQGKGKTGTRLWTKERGKLESIVETFERQLQSVREVTDLPIARSTHNEGIDKTDFECSLCFRVFWQPVTTPCGHMFCRMCLDRCLDHKPHCPLCKYSLKECLAERCGATTEFMEVVMERFLPDAHRERKRCYEEEMEELSTAGKDPSHGVPLFVCTMAYPDIPCPLHVFEPRYRLMTRQCMESGTRQFGMCALDEDEADGVARFGTMLTIRNLTYYPDGRSIVDAIGCKRFRVLRTSMRDGYYVGSLEFIRDSPVPEVEVQEVISLHDAVYSDVAEWFSVVPHQTRSLILDHFGPLPSPEECYYLSANGPRWVWWTLAILPIGIKTQIQILGMNTLEGRLKALWRLVGLVRRFGAQGVIQ